jgi:hypothetical protein
MTYTPKRALLSCRFQKEGLTLAEINPSVIRTVDPSDLATDEPFKPEWLGEMLAFPYNRAHAKDTAITYSGYLACYVMFPFLDTETDLSIVVGVDELDENGRLVDFEVFRVPSSRLRIARAVVDYIQIARTSEFIHAIAGGDRDGSRSDILEPGNGLAN